MDDQVGKLRERGFVVAAIHSGRERTASRQACIDYLGGKLQFLFIAPEPLRVPGFLLGGMALAGLVQLSEATFEKDGKQISYCTVSPDESWTRGGRIDAD